MARLEFYATRSDQQAIIDFLFAETDVRIFESYSEFDQQLREFRSFSELDSTFHLGSAPDRTGIVAYVVLWSPGTKSACNLNRIELDPKHCKDHTFRYSVTGWGLISLQLGGIYNDTITPSLYHHYSERRAMAESDGGGVDWAKHTKLSNKVQYHIRGRLAAAKALGRVVLPEALSLAQSGYRLMAGPEFINLGQLRMKGS